jgi:beta-galactosidase
MLVDEKEASVTTEYGFPILEGKGCTISYQFLGNDICKITMKMEARKELASVPQFGFTFSLLPEFNRVRYYGRGPEETYCDRKAGGRLGIHSHKVTDMIEPYLNPQEMGNRTDIRFIEISNDDGVGIRLFSEVPFEGSVLPYSSHELENAGHINELPPITKTVVNVAMAKSGVGGDDSWGAPIHPEYLVKVDQPLEFSIYIQSV